MSDPTPAPADDLDAIAQRIDRKAENITDRRRLVAMVRAERERADRATETVSDRDATIEGLHSYCEKADVCIDRLRARLDAHKVVVRDVVEEMLDAVNLGSHFDRADVDEWQDTLRALLTEGDTDGP